ncbi:hypothetical protein M422DRAFT_29685 [Sphaerobolus stellatus SS14]|uniref:Unplaced genomic scaffold SPHSTscaffold_36, whole genome shotgun sequence n=1 Tax=Sphaerobolus stellatus (strain SS14) TaxID=990650 RepID=A0A0C9W383_SPHS4|nr:hypothetical protein M422DRAFT_29685 [Sphaerobolus stellatus SS14]
MAHYPHPDPHPINAPPQLLASAWHALEQQPPPTMREILSAYKNKGDGDREMLLAMLNAKSAEDQRIAAVVTLHQRLLDTALPPRIPSPHEQHYYAQAPPPLSHYPPPPPTASSSSSLPRISPSASPQNVTLPSIHSVQQSNPRKRTRTSRSPGRHSVDSSTTTAPSDQLPPSPPFSSPGRSSASELSHTAPRDAMAIGSLLSSSRSKPEFDSEWPSRTSAERERDTYQRPAKVSG